MPKRSLDYRTPSPTPAKANIALLAAGGGVLIVYPFCLIANVMSLAALPATAGIGLLPSLARKAFLWGSTIYPVLYLFAAGMSVFLSSNDRQMGTRRIAQAPLIYLAGLLLCFVIAIVTGG